MTDLQNHSIASFPEGARDCSTCFRTCEKMIKLFLFTTRLPIGHTNTTQCGLLSYILNYADDNVREGHSVCHWIDVVVPQCPALRALKFSAVLTSHLTPGQPVSEMNKFPQPLTFTTALEEVNYRLGFDDTKTPIEEHRHGLEAEWEWIADKGKTLTWRKR
jgi:hypothetical protein